MKAAMITELASNSRRPFLNRLWLFSLLALAIFVSAGFINLFNYNSLYSTLTEIPIEKGCHSFNIDKSDIPSGCTLINKVCVDQGTFILHDPAHQEPHAIDKLPKVSPVYVYPHTLNNVDNAIKELELTGEYRRHMDPPRFRLKSALEPTPYLSKPKFSTCTVPIIVYMQFFMNYWHSFADTTSWISDMMGRIKWAGYSKLIIATPEQFALPNHLYTLLEPLSNMTVESLGEFSSRIPPGNPVIVGQGVKWLGQFTPEKPATWEGMPQRCFEQLMVCGRKGGKKGGGHLWNTGQALARYYKPLAPKIDLNFTSSSSRGNNNNNNNNNSYNGGGGGGGRNEDDKQSRNNNNDDDDNNNSKSLKVVFHRRSLAATRQLVNLHDLLDRCKTWSYTEPTSNIVYSLHCSEWEFTDILSSVAVSQVADVFVSLHGASEVNAYMMKPGSSIIEVIPFAFSKYAGPRGQFALGSRTVSQPGAELHWWLLQICDPAAFKPGNYEIEKVQPEHMWFRDRHAVLEWSALETVLRQIAYVGGDTTKYQELFDEDKWWWQVFSGGEAKWGDRKVLCE
jgi:hypothetical protein